MRKGVSVTRDEEARTDGSKEEWLDYIIKRPLTRTEGKNMETGAVWKDN